jgi:hypothetical protein
MNKRITMAVTKTADILMEHRREIFVIYCLYLLIRN